MRRVFRAAMLTLGVVVLAALCWYFLRPGARRIQGRTRDEWITGLAKGMSAADIEQWRSLGPQAVPLLVRALRTGDGSAERWYREHWYSLPKFLKKRLAWPQDPVNIRVNAALALGCLTVDITDATPALGHALQDQDQNVRVNASLALKGLVPKLAPAAKAQLVPDLLAALKDQNYLVRQNIIESLGDCPEESRVIAPELARACDDTVQINRYLATRSLKKMNPAEMAKGDAPAALMHCLGSSDTQVCMAAADLLSVMKCDPRREVAAFTEMLGDYRPARQRIGAVALGKYGAQAAPAVPALQHALETGEPRVRVAASNSLEEIRR